jgi:hypothetical protein
MDGRDFREWLVLKAQTWCCAFFTQTVVSYMAAHANFKRSADLA